MEQNVVTYTQLMIAMALDHIRVRVKDVTGRVQRRWMRPENLEKYQVSSFTVRQQPVYSYLQPVRYAGKRVHAIPSWLAPSPPKEEYEGQQLPEYVEVVVHCKITYSPQNPHKDIKIDAYAGMTVRREEYEVNKEEYVKQLEDELLYQLRSAFGSKLIDSIKTEIVWGSPQIREVKQPQNSFILIYRMYFNGIWKALVDYKGPGYDWFKEE